MKVTLVIPVLNEEQQLQTSIRRLLNPGVTGWPQDLELVIADNGSTDQTPEIAERLATEFDSIRVIRLEERGRGRALKTAWTSSDADVLAYMDVDLSTDLQHFPELIAPLLSGEADVAIGSRLLSQSRVDRGWKREFISRSYNRIARLMTGTRISDLQCGFKAINRMVAERVLLLVKDTSWFFDSELLIIAESMGMRIHEVPVAWRDDPDSRVRLVRTAWDDLKGLVRVRKGLRRGDYLDRRISHLQTA